MSARRARARRLSKARHVAARMAYRRVEQAWRQENPDAFWTDAGVVMGNVTQAHPWTRPFLTDSFETTAVLFELPHVTIRRPLTPQ